jgi:hypothetical protein
MPQETEPFKFVKYEDFPIPGIGQEIPDPIYPIDEGSAASHDLRGQPVRFDGTTYEQLDNLNDEYFDNVYMPQPKTRETDHPNNACSSDCYGPNHANPTYDDDYRFWPAKRDRDGGIVGAIYTSNINTGPGCLRYGSVNAKSSDEGAWNSTYGSNFAHTGHFLGSPAYNTVYHATPEQNTFLDGSNFTIANYITSFLNKFAVGYFTDCCTHLVVDADFLRNTVKTWGNFGSNNIRYGIEYYDDDPNGWGCGYWNNGANCCGGGQAAGDPGNELQTCGRLFRPDLLTTDGYVQASPTWVVGGIRAGNVSYSDAGYGWLKSNQTYAWTESDIYATAEPTQFQANPPGKFGIVDNKRTNRHLNEVRCMQSVFGDAANPETTDGTEDLGDPGGDGPTVSERCTAGCLSLGFTPNWFVNEGKTYSSVDYM